MHLDETYENSEKNPKGDLVTGIEHCKSVIKDKKSSDADKAFYLKLLIHLIGDLHQPMHVGKNEDLGGNKIIVDFFSTQSNLHSVWDSDIIEQEGLSFSELTVVV